MQHRERLPESIIKQYTKSGGWIDDIGQPPVARAPASSSSNFIRAITSHRHRHQSYIKRCLERESCRKLNECLTQHAMPFIVTHRPILYRNFIFPTRFQSRRRKGFSYPSPCLSNIEINKFILSQKKKKRKETKKLFYIICI